MKEKLTVIVDRIGAKRTGKLPSHWTQTSSLDFKLWKDNYANFVKLTDLYVNNEYQRNINKSAVLEIAENFATIFSTPILVDRASMEIVDGQQHAAAAYYRGDIEELPVVYLDTPEGIDPAEHLKMLAQAFVDSNALKRMITPMQKFKSSFVAQQSDTVAIEHIIENHGFCCGRTIMGYVKLSSPTMLNNLYATYGATEFEEIIKALSQFSCMVGSPTFMLTGIGMIHQWCLDWNAANTTKYDVYSMVRDAASVAGPNDLYEAIKRVVTWHGTTPNVKSQICGQLVAREIQKRYNVYLKKHKKNEIREDRMVRIGKK